MLGVVFIMKNLVYVIHEIDLDDNERIVVGVADSLANVDKVVDEYYGKYKVVNYEDIRDSNLEWIKIIETDGIMEGEIYRYKIWVEYFCLNNA